MNEERTQHPLFIAPLFQNLDASIKLSCLDDETVAKMIASLSTAESAWKEGPHSRNILRDTLNDGGDSS